MAAGDVRFAFGENWKRYLSLVDEERIGFATSKLTELLGDIEGKTFLDVGCGSGIHSLAAVRLGASRVVSFDFDSQSVACVEELKRRFAPAANWNTQQGSVLEESYLRSLGQFDIVYSWGVLHHTGDMWRALDLVTIPVADKLAIAIYNDQGMKSRVWRRIKAAYNHGSFVRKRAIEVGALVGGLGLHTFVNILRLRPWDTVRSWRNYSRNRGMSPWVDIVDWVGGYPFEVAKPCEVFAFYRQRGFTLEYMTTCGQGNGCNQFTFSAKRSIQPPGSLRAEG